MSDNTSLVQSGVFWVSIATIVIGAYKFSVTYCLKSKCTDFLLCFGLINIKRDIKSEIEIEKVEIEHKDNIGYKKDAVDILIDSGVKEEKEIK